MTRSLIKHVCEDNVRNFISIENLEPYKFLKNKHYVLKISVMFHNDVQYQYCKFCPMNILQGSTFASLPRESYDLFLTAAPCDGVKLWDLRTMK